MIGKDTGEEWGNPDTQTLKLTAAPSHLDINMLPRKGGFCCSHLNLESCNTQ